MTTVQDVCRFLDNFAPPHLAEDWDNVGLLVGDRSRPVQKIMTCLTITPTSADEAVREQVDLIVAHHPLPFKPLKRLTTDNTPGRLLLKLIAAGVAIYSPHTAFDSATAGINQSLAEGLLLTDIQPLVPIAADATGLGSGRFGRIASGATLADVASRVKQFLKIGLLQRVGSLELPLKKIAVACGSAGQFLEPARRAGCDLLITGETNFHTCLEAESLGMGLLLTGHFASERFGVERLATILQPQFPSTTIWPSRAERDPLEDV